MRKSVSLGEEIKALASQAIQPMFPNAEDWKKANGGDKLPSENVRLSQNPEKLSYGSKEPTSVYVDKKTDSTDVVMDNPSGRVAFTAKGISLSGGQNPTYTELPSDDNGGVTVSLRTNTGGGYVDVSGVKADKPGDFFLQVVDGNPTIRLSNETKAQININRKTTGEMVVEIPAALAGQMDVVNGSVKKKDGDESLDLIFFPNNEYHGSIFLTDKTNNVTLHLIDKDGKTKAVIPLKNSDGHICKEPEELKQDIQKGAAMAQPGKKGIEK